MEYNTSSLYNIRCVSYVTDSPITFIRQPAIDLSWLREILQVKKWPDPAQLPMCGFACNYRVTKQFYISLGLLSSFSCFSVRVPRMSRLNFLPYAFIRIPVSILQLHRSSYFFVSCLMIFL